MGKKRWNIFYVTFLLVVIAAFLGGCLGKSEEAKVTGLKIVQGNSAVVIGQELQMTAAITPGNITGKTVKWDSSNKNVATISSNGLVKAVAAGTTTVTASVDNISAEVTVTVSTIKIQQGNKSIIIGEDVTLSAVTSPGGLSVVWSSSNKDVATISASGVVKGISVGTTVITASAGSASDSITVTVETVDDLVTSARNIITNGAFSIDGPTDGTADVIKNTDNSIVAGSKFWFANMQESGDAVFLNDNGAIKTTISNKGNKVYAIQLIQEGVKLAKGATYRLTFDAKASAERTINVKIGMLNGTWTDYINSVPYGDGNPETITTDMTRHKIEFTMKDSSDSKARLELNMGLNSAETVWIDNVALEKIADSDTLDYDGTLHNGDFEGGRLDYWETSKSGTADINTEIVDKNGSKVMKVTVTPGTEPYNPQVMQKELLFEKGKTYTVKFYGNADAARKIQVNAGSDAGGSWVQYAKAPQVFQLGAANQGYTFSFVMTENTGYGKLDFEFGTIDGEAVATSVYLDNIEVTASSGDIVEITPVQSNDIIKNGNFDINMDNWAKSGDVEILIEKQELKAVIANSGSTGNSVVINQSGLKLENGIKYDVAFDARALDNKKVNVKFTNSNGTKSYYSKVFDIGLSNKTNSFSFTMGEATDESARMDFELGNVDFVDTNTTVYLDKITVKDTSSKKYLDPSLPVEERVTDLLSQMTLDEKLGQMVQAERLAVNAGDITKYGIGSLLSGGGSAPANNTPEGWAQMYDAFQGEALATRLGIPLIYGVDAVHGHTNVPNATAFPHNIGLGAARNADLVKQIAAITAEEVASTGINWDFSPCVAVTRDERWGRSYESYGETAELQTLLASAFVEGLQGNKNDPAYMKGNYGKAVGCAKHFMGDGGAEWGTGESATYTVDRGNVTVFGDVTDGKTITNRSNFDKLVSVHGQGYINAVNSGIGTVMASFSMINGVHMHNNKALLTDYLKGELGFDGFIIGDWDAMSLITEVAGTHEDRVIASFNAGLDMSMEQSKWKEVIGYLKSGLESGKITQTRIDDAVRRILRIKFRAGLFEHPLSNRSYISNFGSDGHREVAAQAVRESMVLLKNQNNILPLKKNAKIYVTGPLSNDVGLQNGGWTVAWQGGKDSGGTRYTKGTSILDGIRKIAESNGGQVITNDEDAALAEVAVVVVGEKPYAEGVGDIQTSDSMTLADGKCVAGNLEAIQKALDLKIPVVVITVSGRPLIITDEIDKWDAFVAAWLPGSEGGAMADVLFGNRDFKGKLSVTWPRSLGQLPINADDADYSSKNPLFKYGEGLSMGTTDSELEYTGIYKWLEEHPAAEVNKPKNIPAKIEAENYSNMSGVQTEGSSDTGGTDNLGWIDKDDWMEYYVNVAKTGEYTIDYRVAGWNSGSEIQLLDPKDNNLILTSTAIPNSGGYQVWQTVTSQPVTLAKGVCTLRFKATGAFNFNWFEAKSTETVNPNPELIVNGTFDTNTTNWDTSFLDYDWAGNAKGSAAVENSELKASVTAEGSQWWSIQVSQGGKTLESGKTYVLSFDAKSVKDRNIMVSVEESGNNGTHKYSFTKQALTTNYSAQAIEFTADQAESNGKIVIGLGKPDGDTDVGTHDVYLDNISLKLK